MSLWYYWCINGCGTGRPASATTIYELQKGGLILWGAHLPKNSELKELNTFHFIKYCYELNNFPKSSYFLYNQENTHFWHISDASGEEFAPIACLDPLLMLMLIS